MDGKGIDNDCFISIFILFNHFASIKFVFIFFSFIRHWLLFYFSFLFVRVIRMTFFSFIAITNKTPSNRQISISMINWKCLLIWTTSQFDVIQILNWLRPIKIHFDWSLRCERENCVSIYRDMGEWNSNFSNGQNIISNHETISNGKLFLLHLIFMVISIRLNRKKNIISDSVL